MISFNGERLVPENYTSDFAQTFRSKQEDIFSGLEDDSEER